MKIKQALLIVAILLVGAVVAALILRSKPAAPEAAGHGSHGEEADGEAGHDAHAGEADHEAHDGEEGKAHAGEGEAEYLRGSHGGRLLADGNFGVEVTLVEQGAPPQFRVYLYRDGQPLPPTAATVSIDLRRLGGRVDRFQFTPQGDYLVGNGAVEEPHSFDVTVVAEHDGNTSRWTYESHEGRIQLDAASAQQSGIAVEPVGPATLRRTLRVTGRIAPNEDRLAHVIPRYPGIVKETRKRLGDAVARGEVLAIVQSNESLQPYPVPSLIDGTVIMKHVTPGEFAGQGEDIYVVADLSTVWVDLNIYRQDFDALRVGQAVELDAGEGVPPAQDTITYISPFGAENTQTMLARVVLPNPSGQWRPGLFVSGEVLLDEVTVPLAVRATGVQRLRDWDVVFIREGDLYEAQPLELGQRDPTWVEVRAGLQPGQEYVATNSFILKADVGKSGASHDH